MSITKADLERIQPIIDRVCDLFTELDIVPDDGSLALAVILGTAVHPEISSLNEAGRDKQIAFITSVIRARANDEI